MPHCSFHRDDVSRSAKARNGSCGSTRRRRGIRFRPPCRAPSSSAIHLRPGRPPSAIACWSPGEQQSKGTLFSIRLAAVVSAPSPITAPWWREGWRSAPKSLRQPGRAADRPDEVPPAPLYAFKPDGSAIAALMPPFPVGATSGIESIASFPVGRPSGGAVFLADRGHQGKKPSSGPTRSSLTASQLRSAGVRARRFCSSRRGGR